MSVLFSNVRHDFHIVGELEEKRIVTSPKQPDWQLHILKFSGKGCLLEVEVTKEEFERAVLQEPYQVVGNLGAANGRMKAVARKVERLAVGKQSAE